MSGGGTAARGEERHTMARKTLALGLFLTVAGLVCVRSTRPHSIEGILSFFVLASGVILCWVAYVRHTYPPY